MISEKALSKIFYNIDPMGTCCNVNKNMRDEYDAEARLTIAYMLDRGFQFHIAITRAFDAMFYDGCLSKENIVQLTAAYNKLPLES